MITRIDIKKNELLFEIDENVREETNEINLQPLTNMTLNLFDLALYTLQEHLQMAIQ